MFNLKAGMEMQSYQGLEGRKQGSFRVLHWWLVQGEITKFFSVDHVL